MLSKNLILGICAALLAVGGAIASIMSPTPFKVRRVDGLEFAGFTADQTDICPYGQDKFCKVKLVNSANMTIVGYTAATVLTAGGASILTHSMTSVHTIKIPD